jgi:hypothetical protein
MTEYTDEEIFTDADMLISACGTADGHAELAARVKSMANYLRSCDPKGRDIKWLDEATKLLTRAAAYRGGVPSGDQYDKAMDEVISRYWFEGKQTVPDSG